MSGGQHDAQAVSDIGNELEEAAYALRDAIRRAQEGHRGLTVSIPATVNPILAQVGYWIDEYR